MFSAGLLFLTSTCFSSSPAHNNSILFLSFYSSLLNADFASASVLISFGAVLGVTTPLQLIVMAICEIAIFASNEHLGLEVLHVSDVGASMLVHVFGAYFGLAVSLVLKRDLSSNKEGASYTSDTFAMIGIRIYQLVN